jgi:uncharacterized protein (DUF2267 family)/predicted transcriptional regulator
MIVLSPRASVYEAARAMAENGVGAIVVSDERRIAGIITDRDLALEVAAADVRPRETALSDVMTEDVCSVDIAAEVEQAVHAMRRHGCRRVPVTEHGRAVGMVSLDDLIIEGAIDLATAAAVIREQLRTAGGAFKAEGSTHPEAPARPEMATGRGARALMRHRARAELAYSRLLHNVESHTGLTPREDAEHALLIVLGAVCRRVRPDDARDLIAQLPSTLKPDLERILEGPDRRITRQSIQAELIDEVHVSPDIAGAVLDSVGNAIADTVSSGEIEGLRGQLPLDLKDLFP